MTAPASVGDVALHGVYLSGSTDRGPTVVGGLGLLADGVGLTVLGPEAGTVRRMPWGRASTVACRSTARMPDGCEAAALEVDIDGFALRLFVPLEALGPQGPQGLEDRLSLLAGIPARIEPPLGPIFSAPDGKSPVGKAQDGAAGGVPVQTTGGTPETPEGTGVPDVQGAKKSAGTARRIAAVVGVIVVVCGAAALAMHYFDGRKSNPATSPAAVSAASVNLDAGEMTGWRGVAGTVGGAIGSLGYKETVASGSAHLPRAVAQPPGSASASFSRCLGEPAGIAAAALGVLGFGSGASSVSGATEEASSPLFEDASQAGTNVESDAIVFGSDAAASAGSAVFRLAAFPRCLAGYLDEVVPKLVGGVSRGSFDAATVRRVALGAPVTEHAEGLSFNFSESDGARHVYVSETADVISGGRFLASVETISVGTFPHATASRVVEEVEQGVAGEMS